MQVIVDGLLVNYLRQGRGKKILLLHGWANSISDLKELSDNLSKDFEVIVPDLPGFGSSQPPETAWGLKDFAEFLGHFIKKIEAKDIYGLIGHSNGGAIAIKALSSGLVTPDKLVLLASSGIRRPQPGRQRMLRLVTKTAKVASLPLPIKTKKVLRQKLYTTLGSDLLTAENMAPSFKKIVTEDMENDASKILIPTLLIYGEKDDQTPLLFGEIYHQAIKDSTLEVIGGSGHFLQKEKPLVVVRLIRDFLC